MSRRGLVDELRERMRSRMKYCRTCGQPTSIGLRKTAALLKVSPASLSRFINGKDPSGPMIDKMALWLGVGFKP